MALSSLNCPNCGAAYNPAKMRCEFCNSFIIMTQEKSYNIPVNIVSEMKSEMSKGASTNNYPGIYIFGSLIGRGEIPLRLGLANYYKSALFNVGGKILLTEKNLYFSSHTFAQGKTDLCVPLDSIEEVSYDKNMIISDQISVYSGGKRHKFVVYSGKEWVNIIKDTMNGKYIVPPAPQTSPNETAKAPSVSVSSGDYTEELIKLKQLFDAGVITEDEFAIKKRQILNI